MPNPGNDGVAVLALVADQIIPGNKIALAFDQQLFAIMAIRMGAFMIGNVAEVNITDAFLDGQIPQALQG
jgi:hypothetical protein